MYESLPPRERTFQLDLVGNETGHKYEGTFTVKCNLTIGERHGESTEKTRLMLNFTNPHQDLLDYAESLAVLRYRIIEAPEWWKQSDGGSKLRDENVLFQLYKECLRLEKEWRDALSNKAKEVKELDSDKENPQGNS